MNSSRSHGCVRVGLICLTLVLAPGVAGCTDDGEGAEDGAASYTADIQPIWDASCTNGGCHMMGGAGSFLDLSGDAHDDLVGVGASQATGSSIVEAGDSTGSYLVAKLRGTQIAFGGSGGMMPFGGDPLPEATIVMIEEWIDGGALP